MAQKTYRKKSIEGWKISIADFAAIVVWCTPDASDAGTTSIVIDSIQGGIDDYVMKDEFGAFFIIDEDELAFAYQDDSTFADTIVLKNGETIDNAVNGLVNITGNIGVNATKVVGAQVAAIGLDAKADAAKITDLIAALRAHGLIGPNA